MLKWQVSPISRPSSYLTNLGMALKGQKLPGRENRRLGLSLTCHSVARLPICIYKVVLRMEWSWKSQCADHSDSSSARKRRGVGDKDEQAPLLPPCQPHKPFPGAPGAEALLLASRGRSCAPAWLSSLIRFF